MRRVIIGGGLTGLTTAYLLAKRLGPEAASHIILIEKQDRLGGWVDSRLAQCTTAKGKEVELVLESGPRSIRPRGGPGAATMLRLIQDLGMQDDILPVTFDKPAAKNRFILDPRSHKLIKLPSSLSDIFISSRSPLTRALVSALLKEPFKKRRRISSNEELADESLDTIVRRRLGPYIADNLISAMIHGIYAADSRRLSVRSTLSALWDAEQKAGSIVLGMMRGVSSATAKEKEAAEWSRLSGNLAVERKKWSLYGLKGGLGALTDRMTSEVRRAGVDIRTGVGASLIDSAGGAVKIVTSAGDLAAEQLFSTIHPSQLSPLLPSNHDLPHLTHNPSTTVGVVNIVFPLSPAKVHPPGFGYLIPRSERSANPDGVLGVVFDSTAVEGVEHPEAARELTKLTVMIGGPHWTDYVPERDRATFSRPSQQQLEEIALSHLRRTFPHLADVKPSVVSARIHVDCIPTYLPGHGQRLRDLHESVLADKAWAGKLIQLGSGYGGVGVNDCVFMASEAIDRMQLDAGPVTGLERWAEWQ